MSTLAVDRTTGGPAWPLVVVGGIEEAVSKMLIRLRTELGEVPADVSIGLPLARWQRSPRPTPQEVAVLVRVQCEAVDGVTVQTVTATVGQAIAVEVAFTYTDEAGTVEGVATVPLYEAYGLPSWYAAASRC